MDLAQVVRRFTKHTYLMCPPVHKFPSAIARPRLCYPSTDAFDIAGEERGTFIRVIGISI